MSTLTYATRREPGSTDEQGPAAWASLAGVQRLRDARPDDWHRAAAAWSTLAEQLTRLHERIDGSATELDAAWAAGSGTGAARACVAAQRIAVRDAQSPARQIAAALTEHGYALAALRRLAHQDLPHTERVLLLAQVRALDERTRATLLANRPPPAPAVLRERVGLRTDVARAVVQAQTSLSPQQVRAWWDSLTQAQRDRVLADDADVVGWLDGIPAVDRDRANRTLLAAGLDRLSAAEADLVHMLDRLRLPAILAPTLLLPVLGVLELRLARVRAQVAGLQAVRTCLERLGPRALLLGIDPGTGVSDGRAIVALSDPDHARHTAVLVPGVDTDLGDTPGELDRIGRLRDAADALTVAPDDVSLVYWLGYDAPQDIDALSYDASRAGAGQLTGFIDGLRSTHDPGPSHITVVGHSYGSTVVAEAALRGGLPVDDIIAAGSPGMHTDHATDLHLDPRHVWGGLAAGDLIGGALGELPFVHGEEPTDPAFGANQFVVDTQGHSAYWDPGSLSLRNQAAIVVGRYDLVALVHGQPPAD